MQYSIPFLICSAPKDYIKLPYVIDALLENYNNITEIFLVTPINVPDNIKNQIGTITNRISYILESSLPIDKSRINFRSPGWITQQLVKLLAERIIFPNRGYRAWGVIDSDTILNRPIPNPKDGKPIFYRTHNQHHQPYFDFIGKYMPTLLNSSKNCYSFIAEIMIFQKCYIDAIIGNTNKFLEFCYNNINNECYLSEYELYGNFVSYVNNNIIDIHLNNTKYSKINQDWTEKEIQQILGKSHRDFDTISLDSISF